MDVALRAILSGFKEAAQQFTDLNKEIDKTASATDKLNAAGGKASGAVGDLGGAAADAAKGFSLLEKGVVLAAGAIGTAFVSAAGFAVASAVQGFQNVRQLGDEFANMSQKTGIAVETLGSYQLAAQTNTLSMQQFSMGLVQFNRHILDATKGTGEAADAFGRVGIALRDQTGNLKNTDDLLREVADAFAGMKDGAGKTALAMELFGRAGADLIPLLNEGARGLAKLQEEARKAGIVIDSETAEAAKKLNENLAVLKAYGQGFWMEIAAPIVEGMAKITTAMRDARREGEGLFGSLQAGAVKGVQLAAGVGDDKQELSSVTARLQELYKERAVNQGIRDTGTPADALAHYANPVNLLSGVRFSSGASDKEIQELEARRDQLAGVLAINNPTGYSEVPMSGKREAPTKPEKVTGAGRGASMESQAGAEARMSQDRLKAGEITREEYVAQLDELAEAYKDYEAARLHMAALAAEERRKMADEEGKHALALLKIGEATEKDFRQKEDHDFLLSMHAQREIREREVERDVTLTHEQKAERLQAIRDELDMWTSVYPQVKREVVALDKKISDERLATELEYQRQVHEILGKSTFNMVPVFQSMSLGLQKTFEEMIRGHLNFKKSVNSIWQGIVDSIISEIARLAARAVLEPLMQPMKEIFSEVGSWIKDNVFSPVWDFIKSGFSSLVSSLGETDWSPAFSGFNSEINSTMEEGGSISNLYTALGGLGVGIGGGLLAGSVTSGKKGPGIGTLAGTGIGMYFGGPIGGAVGGAIGGLVDSFFPTGTDMVVTKPTAFVAGDMGPERVVVSPMSGAARNNMGGSGGGIVNHGIMVVDEYTMRKFKRMLSQ